MKPDNLIAVCQAVLWESGIELRQEELLFVAEYVSKEIESFPDYLRLPFRGVAWLFFFHGALVNRTRFSLASKEKRIRHIGRWRACGGFCADFVKLLECLSAFRAYELVGASR